MGFNEIHSWVLRKLSEEVAKSQFIVFEKLWHPFFKKEHKEELQKYSLVNRTSVFGKIKEQILMETMSRLTEDHEVIGDSQHGFSKGKLCLTNLVAFRDEVIALMEEERTTDIRGGDEDHPSAQAPPLQRQAEGVWAIQPEEKKALGRP